MPKLIACDFHGVFSKHNEKAVQYYCNMVFQLFGLSCRIDLATIVRNYGIGFKDIFKIVFPEGSPELFVEMEKCIFEHQVQSFETVVRQFIRPQAHARFTIEMLRNYGHRCIVVSNTPQYIITKFTDAVDLTDCFDEIVGVDRISQDQGLAKLPSLKAQVIDLCRRKWKSDQIVMIGDAASDIEAGRLVGAKTYLYATPTHDEVCDCSLKWENIIQQTSPDYVIRDLRYLIQEI